MQIPSRSTYAVHAVLAIVALIAASLIDGAYRDDALGQGIAAILNIGGVIVFLGSAYKVIWYKKYTEQLMKNTKI